MTDPGSDTVTNYIVHWGDGATDTYSTNGVQTHVYADVPNAYDITVDLVDEDGTFAEAANALSVTVDNVAPALTVSGNSNVDEGSLYTLNLASSDPGTDTIDHRSIDWGDGSGVEILPGNPSFATHVYADGPNSYSIHATATDEDGTFAAGVPTAGRLLVGNLQSPADIWAFDAVTGNAAGQFVSGTVWNNSNVVAADMTIGPDGLLYVAGHLDRWDRCADGLH